VAAEWERMVGTRYSYMQYPALALLAASELVADERGKPRQEFRPDWLLDYIARSDRIICSQLVDIGFERHGIHLFTDHRAPGDVTPGDLWGHLDPELAVTPFYLTDRTAA
jgi:hypothetical protein